MLALTAAGAGTVRFEVPAVDATLRLSLRLRPRWNFAVSDQDDVTVVAVQLGTDEQDLAVLLREVEKWVAQESLRAIRFQLDGRGYVLEAGDPDWRRVPGVAA